VSLVTVPDEESVAPAFFLAFLFYTLSATLITFMTRHRELALSVFLATLLFSSPGLFAYTASLTDNDVREAYFFGQRHDASVGHFFDQYEKALPVPASGFYVRAIGIRTPYSQAVWRSFERGSTYTLGRARKDYAARPDVIQVVVWVTVPNAYAPPVNDPASDVAARFTLELSQGHVLHPLAVPPPIPEMADNSLAGVQISAEYDVRDVSSAPARVTVKGPQGSPAFADFDLSRLR
jgi:hypothetical protein